MQIDLKEIELLDYVGAGNRTPVLDISNFVSPGSNPLRIRAELETNKKFRKWLKEEGLKHRADSVMIFYKSDNSDYDFVTFIGEPNGPVEGPFSEMCGNGIRSLALHVVLNSDSASL